MSASPSPLAGSPSHARPQRSSAPALRAIEPARTPPPPTTPNRLNINRSSPLPTAPGSPMTGHDFNDGPVSLNTLRIALCAMKDRCQKQAKRIDDVERENLGLQASRSDMYEEVKRLHETNMKLREKNLKLSHESQLRAREFAHAQEELHAVAIRNVDTERQVERLQRELAERGPIDVVAGRAVNGHGGVGRGVQAWGDEDEASVDNGSQPMSVEYGSLRSDASSCADNAATADGFSDAFDMSAGSGGNGGRQLADTGRFAAGDGGQNDKLANQGRRQAQELKSALLGQNEILQKALERMSSAIKSRIVAESIASAVAATDAPAAHSTADEADPAADDRADVNGYGGWVGDGAHARFVAAAPVNGARVCPMCECFFEPAVSQEEFEAHVVEHFSQEESETLTAFDTVPDASHFMDQ